MASILAPTKEKVPMLYVDSQDLVQSVYLRSLIRNFSVQRYIQVYPVNLQILVFVAFICDLDTFSSYSTWYRLMGIRSAKRFLSLISQNIGKCYFKDNEYTFRAGNSVK